MTVTTRFAPSPTGRLHAGNIRTALVNWLVARAAGGHFLLRLDDTDPARSSEAAAVAIRDDLRWLGLHWDGEARQSDRFALYDAALARLQSAGRVYPAWESAEELDLKRKVQRATGKPPVYDRAALALTDAERAQLEADRRPHWRFRLDTDRIIEWADGVRGPSHIDPASISDPIVRREDGGWLYLLPSVIDDIDLGVTDIVRGEDHVTNSAIQIQMFEALGVAPPRLAHLPLMTGADAALSKRLGSDGVPEWRAAGIEPQAVAALLARLGTASAPEPIAALTALFDGFGLDRFGRAPVRFDPADLAALSARAVHHLPFDAVRDRLPAGVDETLWLAVRGNLATVAEASDWLAVVAGDVAAEIAEDDRGYVAEAGAALAALPWGDDIWSRWTAALKSATGRKGKALFQPLRQALTGRDHGPEMAALLPLIGRDRALARLVALGRSG